MPVVAAAAQAATHLANQGFRAPAWDAAFADAAFPLDRAVEDGAGVDYLRGGLAEPVMSACSRRILLTFRQRLVPCCSPKPDIPAVCLLSSPPPTMSLSPAHSFGFCCFVGYVFPWRSAPAHAAAAEASTLLGVHRAACATSGVLPTRALPLEHALARVCRKAGARVARNVRVADMNIDVPVSDARRIEVVCNGLPLWHGAQLAVDATLVSPLAHDGSPQPATDAQPGVSLAGAAQRKRRHTCPELLRARRCRLVVFGLETGGRWSQEAVTFLRLLAQARAASAPPRRAPRCSGRLGAPLEWHPFGCRAASLRNFAP